MAIFTAIGTAVAGAIGFAGTAAATVGSFIGGALAFGARALLGSYLNRKKARPYSAVQGEIQIGGNIPSEAVFGMGGTKGHRLYYAKLAAGDEINYEVLALSNGWCDGLEPYVYLYGKKKNLVELPKIGNEVAHYGIEGYWYDDNPNGENCFSIRFYDGRPGQQVDQKLVDDTAGLDTPWKATSRVSGHCYVVVRKRFDGDIKDFTEGNIPELKFVLRGLREYDPRKDSTVAGGSGAHRVDDPATWEWTENPAVHRLNYQLGLRGLISGRTIIGEGKTLGQIDLGTYFASMNVCDTLKDGKPTYACSLIVNADDDHTEVLKEFDDAMAGYGLNRRGLSGVIAGAPQLPVLEITKDDIPADRAKELKYRKSAFELYNHMSGQFTSIEDQWNPVSLEPIRVNADVAADGRIRQTSNDFLQVTDPDIAQYLLTIRYRQQRLGGKVTLPVSRRVGLAVSEGQWVEFEGREWLVQGWNLNEDFRFTLTLAETSAAVYDAESIQPGPIVVPSSPPINPDNLPNVQNFVVEVGLVQGAGGMQTPALRFTWTPPGDVQVTEVRFQYGPGTGVPADPFEDVCKFPERGEYVTTKNVEGGHRYVARCTITTVPDRFKTPSQWVVTADVTDVRFSDILDDSVTASKIAEAAVTADKLMDEAVTSIKLAAEAVTESKLAVGAASERVIAAGAVVAEKIADLAVTSQKVANSAIDTAKLANGAVDQNKVADAAINAAKLASNAVTAVKLADEAVTAAKIGPLAVTAGKVADAAIETSKLANGSVDQNKVADAAIVAAKIANGAVTHEKIVAGAIYGDKIAAGSITTEKLVVTGAGNAINPDVAFEDRAIWDNPSSTSGGGGFVLVENSNSAYFSNYLNVVGKSFTEYDETQWAIDPEKTYLLTVVARRTAGNGGFYGIWRFFDRQGNVISTPANNWPSQNNTAARYYHPSFESAPFNYTKYTLTMGPEGTAQIPAGAVSMSFGFIAGYNETQTTTTRIGMVQVSEMARGELVVDGAIVATKLAANAVTAAKIAAGAITATEISSGAITSDKVAANAITTAKIAAGAIATNQLAADAVTSEKIVAGAITTEKLVVTGAGSAVNPDPMFTDPSIWTNPSYAGGVGTWQYYQNGNNDVPNYVSVVGGLQLQWASTRWTIDKSKTYLLRMGLYSDGTPDRGFYGSWTFYNKEGDQIEAGILGWPGLNQGLANYYAPAGSQPNHGWNYYSYTMGPEGELGIPPNAVEMHVGAYFNYRSGLNETTGRQSLGIVQVTEMARGELIVDGAISATKIKAGAVTAGKIAANAVTATEIASGSVSTAQLAANGITAAKIQAGTITATEMAAGSITTVKLAAGAVTAEKIQGSTITGDKIAGSTITGNNLVARSITARELVLTDFENLIPDGTFSNGDFSGWVAASSEITVGPRGGGGNARQTAPTPYIAAIQPTTSNKEIIAAQNVPVTPGEQFAVGMDLGGAGSAPYSRVLFRVLWKRLDGSTIFDTSSDIVKTSVGWSSHSWTKTVPADAATLEQVSIYRYGSSQNSGESYVTNVFMRRKKGASLIVDGAITADKLDVNSLSAITGNVGELIAGLVRSTNNKIRLDLDGELFTMDD